MTDKNILKEKTQALLEYPRIMESVASFSVSEEAAEILRKSKPEYDKDTAIKKKEIVKAVYSLLNDNEPRLWLPSIGFLLPKIETSGAVLDLDEALAVALFAERGLELCEWLIKSFGSMENSGYYYSDDKNYSGKKEIFLILDVDEKPDALQSQSEKNAVSKNSGGKKNSVCFKECKIVSTEIFKIIDRDGNLRDLPQLRAIKKRIGSLEKELKSAISRYASDDEYKRMLQSAIPSQRDGRTVIAVKANYRGRINGIVHEVSSSGQTIFLEPSDVVEKNNQIMVEKRNLDAEIHKIMRELTEKIAEFCEFLKIFHAKIIELECYRAKAHYSAATKGNFTFNVKGNDECLLLKNARHPLLKNAVPIDIEMKGNIRTLIITGPNTGGKTVALKTLGLFAMMNQSALALPLKEGILPAFDGIFADIGDEQSINQSLSTFSAHIINISAITNYAAEKSLVLLDELGSGTDPEEGTAIAMAILDYLIEKKSRMIITTHHGVLKHYGYTKEGVENASVEFDTKTLSPTYKIINGIPGESRALDIAAGNGLDSCIVTNARKYIEEGKSDVSELIKGLEQKQRELNAVELKNSADKNKINEERRKTDLKELKLRQKEAELKRETLGKLHDLLNQSRKTLENLVRELKETESSGENSASGIDREKTLKVKEFLQNLAHNVDNERIALDEEEKVIMEHFLNTQEMSGKIKRENIIFSAGMEVYAGKSRLRGVIVRADKKKHSGNTWIVKTGSVKSSFPESELLPATFDKKTSSANWTAEYDTAVGAVFELKLLGMRLNDAIDALKHQIEAAILSGLKSFSVVHGTGNGILQKGIHDYLKNEPTVADFHFSRPELGGFGRTEVVMR